MRARASGASAPAIGDGLRLAAGTLTVLPVHPPSRVDRSVAGVAMATGWLVVAPMAAMLAFAGWWTTAVDAPPLLVATLALGLLALSSRGLHLDGLADTADGLAASYERRRALAVMHTGDVGPAGAATLVLVLLVQASSVAALAGHPWLIGVCVVLSRAMLAVGCMRGVPAARAEGLGATVAGSVARPVAVAVLLVATGAAIAAAVLDGGAWWVGLVPTTGALVGTVVVLHRCVHRLGGVTGDVLGAVVEVALAGSLAAAALV